MATRVASGGDVGMSHSIGPERGKNQPLPMSGYRVTLLATLAACAADPIDDEALGLDSAEIIGGSVTSEYPAVPLLTVGWPGEGGNCSGTLVSPRVILTAAHCLDNGGPATSVKAYFGSTVTGGDSSFVEEIEGEDWIFVDDWSLSAGDFGLILLAHDASVEPMAYNTTALSSAHQ